MKNVLFILSILLLSFFQVSGQSAFINEINYLASNPTGRGVEVAGVAGSNLNGWSLVGYNAAGAMTSTKSIQNSIIPNQQNGYGTIWYDMDQYATGGGTALVDPSGVVTQFLSYGAASIISAVNGPAAGMSSQYVGSQILPFSSLQLKGLGISYLDFLWALPLGTTKGKVNISQIFGLLPPLFAGAQEEDANIALSQTPELQAVDQASSKNLEVLVYPNPFADFVQVRLNEPSSEAFVRIFDSTGRLVESAQFSEGAVSAEFDLGHLQTGRYILQIQDGEFQKTQSIVKK